MVLNINYCIYGLEWDNDVLTFGGSILREQPQDVEIEIRLGGPNGTDAGDDTDARIYMRERVANAFPLRFLERYIIAKKITTVKMEALDATYKEHVLGMAAKMSLTRMENGDFSTKALLDKPPRVGLFMASVNAKKWGRCDDKPVNLAISACWYLRKLNIRPKRYKDFAFRNVEEALLSRDLRRRDAGAMANIVIEQCREIESWYDADDADTDCIKRVEMMGLLARLFRNMGDTDEALDWALRSWDLYCENLKTMAKYLHRERETDSNVVDSMEELVSRIMKMVEEKRDTMLPPLSDKCGMCGGAAYRLPKSTPAIIRNQTSLFGCSQNHVFHTRCLVPWKSRWGKPCPQCQPRPTQAGVEPWPAACSAAPRSTPKGEDGKRGGDA
ncbi:hypothetical protein E4U42_001754 [Claviceps africana]|uniref:RING-type domain-containing protein n=1 Tax=Claviceps africana TaxID=83212 RepID=A0A8K0J472_9HYPO|nr:hypothetical protein E4U42_001754 [Claviceps africana]